MYYILKFSKELNTLVLKKTIAMTRRSSLILKFLLFLSFTTLTLTTNYTKSQKLVTKLIHHNSIFSPSYNPNQCIKDQADRTLKNSNARFGHLQAKLKRNLATCQANLVADNYGLLVKFSIGQPPIPQLAVMDTGSTFIWVQCNPCKKCFKQQGPIYIPSISSTYSVLSCHDSSCYNFPGIFPKCDHLNNCIYRISYMDNSTSKGRIGIEELIFEKLVVPNVVFGCGQENTMTVPGLGTGVFGLGNSRNSIVNKLGLKFSYCIGNILDPLYDFNRLTLGNEAKIEGNSTPFKNKNGLYFITLEGISIGQERLIDIDYDLFKRNKDGSGGVIIDTGTELSYLPEFAYNVIRGKVYSILDGFLRQFVNFFDQSWLCYEGILSQKLMDFPVMILHFTDGADLVLDIESMFFQINEIAFCLALIPFTSKTEHSVIGILAQQNYNVGYDLGEEKIYFQRIDCQLLDD